MKLNAVLGITTAAMLAGNFCTFALCMVEDVEDNSISPEYYYNEEESGDELLAEAAEASVPQENAVTVPDKQDLPLPEHEDIPAETTPPEENDGFDEEAFPVAVTAVPSSYAQSDEREPVSPSEDTGYYDPEEEYPEDYDTDDYDDGSAEAQEQSVYGGDSFKDSTLYTDETEEIFGSADDYYADDDDIVTEPLFPDSDYFDEPEATGEIVVTLFDVNSEALPQDTSVSVSVENGSGDLTGETFTARFDGAVQTVNAYDLICWIVNNEISSSFSDEAIKAQAVAAYSYVKYHNVNGLTPSVLVKKNPSQRIKDMVSSVWGVCCYYNGSVAQTVYMASSSGYTADAKNVWGGSFPYLKSVACPFDAVSDPNYGVVKLVSESEMKYYLENSLGITLSDDPTNWIKIQAYIDGNYVSSINIDDQMTISGRKMRETVFNYKLKSAAFDVSYSDGVFTFTTYGYGHGVGMSQNGANILAKQGYSYSDILKYYFTGIEVL